MACVRWTNPTACHHKVITAGHALRRFNNFILVVGDDFDSFQVEAEREAELGKVRGVCVDSLPIYEYSNMSTMTQKATQATLVQYRTRICTPWQRCPP